MNISKFIAFLMLVFIFLTGILGAAGFSHRIFLSPTDSTVAEDSTLFRDSISVKTIVDTLKPIDNNPLLKNSFEYKLTRYQIDLLDYDGAGDLFEYIPFGFVQDLQTPWQPDEISIFGNGLGDISYLLDGIPLNYRITNSFDLNLISPEIIDSVEIVPLTSGFLYNNFNNPVTVNFLTKDKIASRPYTRIRYYQAPDEAFIDGMFNAYLMSRLNVFLNFSNTTFDDETWFANSYSSSWKANIRLRYLLSKKISLVGTYNYAKSETGLFGGINTSNISEAVNSPRDAEVFFKNRYQKKRRNNFDIKILGRLINNAPTELKFYYQFALNEFRVNENATSEDLKIANNNKYNAAGIIFRQQLKWKFLNFDFISNYENLDAEIDFADVNKTYSLFSNSLRAGLEFGKLRPSVYVKNLKYSSNNFNGYGVELNYDIFPTINFFGGYSENEKPFSPAILTISEESDYSENKNLQVGTKIKSGFLNGSVSFINTISDNNIRGISDSVLTAQSVRFERDAYSGLNLDASFRLSFFLLRFKGSYYLNRDNSIYEFPSENLNAGFYYVNTHFDTNLELRTGFDFHYSGKQSDKDYDFEKNIPRYYEMENDQIRQLSDGFTDLVFTMDFFLSGRIQKRAIIHLSVENILDNNYYIVPNYPARGRYLKFGFSWEFLD